MINFATVKKPSSKTNPSFLLYITSKKSNTTEQNRTREITIIITKETRNGFLWRLFDRFFCACELLSIKSRAIAYRYNYSSCIYPAYVVENWLFNAVVVNLFIYKNDSFFLKLSRIYCCDIESFLHSFRHQNRISLSIIYSKKENHSVILCSLTAIWLVKQSRETIFFAKILINSTECIFYGGLASRCFVTINFVWACLKNTTVNSYKN